MKFRALMSITAGLLTIATLSGCISRNEYEDCARRNDVLKERINTLESEQDIWRRNVEKCQSENDVLRTLADANQKKVNLLLGQNADQQKTINDLANMVGQNALPVSLSTALSAWADGSDMVDFDEKTGMVKLKSDLTFDKGEDSVQAAAREALMNFSKIVNSQDAQAFDIAIVGHTDDIAILKPETRVKHPTNWHLSAHRAISVEKILASGGVSEKRMVVAGFGEHRPVAPNAPGNRGNEKNRRVEIYIMPAKSIFVSPNHIESEPAPAVMPVADNKAAGQAVAESVKSASDRAEEAAKAIDAANAQ